MTSTIKPFKIAIPQADLLDLQQRLHNTRWPDPEPVSDWSQGIPINYLQEITSYWQNSYAWQERQQLLNKFSQFSTQIDGVDIHFIHVRSSHANAVPLLISHGWPGSIVEFQKVIAPLTEPELHGGSGNDAFHVIIPSLPGFGFSGKPSTTGWTVEKIADTWNILMSRLGYPKYFAQGGDWGSMITCSLAILHHESVAAIHINMTVVDFSKCPMDNLTEQEKSALAGAQFYRDWDSGYSKQQSTRPQTIGYGLVDSPVGLAAWILEKFYAWTDCAGHPENILSKDELLDNVMLYWLPSNGASAARIYWESFNKVNLTDIHVPAGCSVFPREIFRASERWAKTRFKNLTYWNELDKGGHFAAFEQPDLFVAEVRNCFRDHRQHF